MKNVINHHFPLLPVFLFRKTKVLKNSIEESKSPLTISNSHLYGQSIQDYVNILNICKGEL